VAFPLCSWLVGEEVGLGVSLDCGVFVFVHVFVVWFGSIFRLKVVVNFDYILKVSNIVSDIFN